MGWPYGAANGTTLKLAKEHGYKMAFTLNEGLANAAFLDDILRVLISITRLKRFASQVAQVREPQTMRDARRSGLRMTKILPSRSETSTS